MRTIEINGHSISVYDDIMEMPVVRYNKYQKYVVLASGVGNDIPAIISKIASMRQMVGKEGKVKKLNAEILALQNAFGFINDGIDPHSLSFACLVAKIDDTEYKSVSEDEIERVAGIIGGIATKRQLMDALYGLKKKSKRHLRPTFRSHTDSNPTSKRFPSQ